MNLKDFNKTLSKLNYKDKEDRIWLTPFLNNATGNLDFQLQHNMAGRTIVDQYGNRTIAQPRYYSDNLNGSIMLSQEHLKNLRDWLNSMDL